MAEKLIARNKKAFYDYEITERLEAGLVLVGTEVKSLRNSTPSLLDCFVHFREGEAFLVNLYIPPYAFGNISNHDPRRTRKLLLHKREIARWRGKTAQKGLTVVPLRLYFYKGKAKVELGLGRGKKNYDKRESIKRRDTERDMKRAVKDSIR